MARETLLAERTSEGHWVGELSTSALSTATAVSALALVQRQTAANHNALIAGGLAWLAANQNADGGWGDTVKSLSNISTSMLCRSAFHIAGATDRYPDTIRRVESWLTERYGKTPAELAEAVRLRYGKDRTFSVPILMTCALAGLVDWREVPSLPFELACFPQSWFRFLRLPVVSYALPALIAIGQAVHHHRPPRNPITRWVRSLSRKRSLRVLEAIQPASGGFLEATPLTSFVTMGLASIGQAEHSVARKAVEFLTRSARHNGSWAIDSNLATWVTTLAINALQAADELRHLDEWEKVRDWLLRQQYKDRHPYTGAKPGGWAWTDLPGGVPDGDDTPGALLALTSLTSGDQKEIGGKVVAWTKDEKTGALVEACRAGPVSSGLGWLGELQNRDGGWPTFCRGWGTLAFDRSGADLTAHTLRALAAWLRRWDRDDFGHSDNWFSDHCVPRGLRYLTRHQRPDGSWLPLWFGNQHAPNDENPTYGTARVLAAYRDLDMMDEEPAQRGIAWLLSVQNADGGWGGAKDVPSSVEETALAVEMLLDAKPPAAEAVNRGLAYLVQQVEAGGLNNPTPIGFYFAKLWYFEKLYPIIFTVAALGRALRKLSNRQAEGLASLARQEHTP
jgi:squalene-hopene/tetraprenyl-beta-curcumene cyclase